MRRMRGREKRAGPEGWEGISGPVCVRETRGIIERVLVVVDGLRRPLQCLRMKF